jgi:ATP-dependent 26S proteasome regulatory subunit
MFAIRAEEESVSMEHFKMAMDKVLKEDSVTEKASEAMFA